MRIFRNLDFCCSFLAIVIVLVFGSLLLRASVAIANRWQGTSSKTRKGFDEEDYDEWIGYRKFTDTTIEGQEIPVPGILKGMLCFLLLSIASFLYGKFIWLILIDDGSLHGRSQGELPQIASHVVGLILGFPISAWILAKILPTRFGSACLVLVTNYILLLMLAVLIFAVFGSFVGP